MSFAGSHRLCETGRARKRDFELVADSDLLRPVFEMAPNVRWIHSRSAGLEDLLFPELIASDIVLTNGAACSAPPWESLRWERSCFSPRISGG